jgi:hypothetical protein
MSHPDRTPSPSLRFQLDPNGRMVAGLLPPAHMRVDFGALQAFGEVRGQKQMVNAKPRIAGPPLSFVIPEGVDRFVRMLVTHGKRARSPANRP